LDEARLIFNVEVEMLELGERGGRHILDGLQFSSMMACVAVEV
jgi:hypothetical protein